MRILVIGANGTIGRAVVAALSTGNEIISASLRSTTVQVDVADPESRMYRSLVLPHRQSLLLLPS